MDDQSSSSPESKAILQLIDDAAVANSRRRFDDLQEVIDAGDRLVAQQIVARTARCEAAVRVADAVMEHPDAKKSWRNLWGLI